MDHDCKPKARRTASEQHERRIVPFFSFSFPLKCPNGEIGEPKSSYRELQGPSSALLLLFLYL